MPTSADEITAAMNRLRAANTELRRRRIDDILSPLDQVVANWMSPSSPLRRQAEAALPRATGFSPEMIRYGLPLLLEPLRAGAVRDLLARELEPAPASGPPVIVHVMSGNIPALSASAMVLSLAIGSCALVKAAQGDQVFPALFASSVADVDPELARCLHATYWAGGDQAIEHVALGDAGLVVAFGSDASIAALHGRCRTRFIGHGHRISFALITREMLASPAALAALAEDVSLWDQRGCLSPQVCFVEGDYDAACGFAAALAPHLDAAAARWPPGVLDLEEQNAVRRFRDEAEWRSLAGEAVELMAARDSLAWTIVVEGESVFRPTPLGRSLRVLPLSHVDRLPEIVAPARGKLEAAGVAAPADRRPAIDDVLRRAGVHWITNVGEMQKPPLAWTQGGRPRVADWIARVG